ncbi:hypothetical protein WMF30_33490 [Sorangium sp. So ce134]
MIRRGAPGASSQRVGRAPALRLLCSPARPEAAAAVFEDPFARRIGNFHIFEWMPSIAVKGDDVASGTRLAELWNPRANSRARLKARPVLLTGRLGSDCQFHLNQRYPRKQNARLDIDSVSAFENDNSAPVDEARDGLSTAEPTGRLAA